MKTNLSLNDKLIRMFLAAILAVVSLQILPWVGVLSLILIFTVIAGWDPVYQIIGFNSSKLKEA